MSKQTYNEGLDKGWELGKQQGAENERSRVLKLLVEKLENVKNTIEIDGEALLKDLIEKTKQGDSEIAESYETIKYSTEYDMGEVAEHCRVLKLAEDLKKKVENLAVGRDVGYEVDEVDKAIDELIQKIKSEGSR